MARTEHSADDNVDRHSSTSHKSGDDTLREQDFLLDDDSDREYERDREDRPQDEPARLLAQGGLPEDFGEHKDFLEQFDEDLYNDRADPPAQGNTADVAMGERRFGSDGDAFTEYAHRRPGEDSSVGVSRDPADIAEDDESS